MTLSLLNYGWNNVSLFEVCINAINMSNFLDRIFYVYKKIPN